MPARYRKTVKLGGGLKLNVNKKSVSLTGGTKGAHHTVSSSGRRTKSASIPGMGLGFRSTSSARQTSASTPGVAHPARRFAQPRSAPTTKPGLFAPKGQKLLYRALMLSQAHAPAAKWMPKYDQAVKHRKVTFAAHVLAGMTGMQAAPDWAAQHLQAAFLDGRPPEADPFVVTHLDHADAQFSIEELDVTQPLSRATLGLGLLQYHLDREQDELAQQVANQLPDTPICRLVRTSVALEAGRPDDAVRLTDRGITNFDDIAALTLALRAAALRQTGHREAALDVAREAMSPANRHPVVLLRARYERGLAYAASGQPGMARNDLAKVYASDSSYRDVAQQLTAISPT